MSRITTERIAKYLHAVWELCAFAKGFSKLSESKLDEFQDDLVELMEEVNDCRYDGNPNLTQEG